MLLVLCFIIGGVVGWAFGRFVSGTSYGLLADIAMGVIGGVIGGWVFAQVNITSGGPWSTIITAAIGAAVFVYALRAFRRVNPA